MIRTAHGTAPDAPSPPGAQAPTGGGGGDTGRLPTLARLWAPTRLRYDGPSRPGAGGVAASPAPGLRAAATVLRTSCGPRESSPGLRRVPSAGALYPTDIVIVVPDPGGTPSAAGQHRAGASDASDASGTSGASGAPDASGASGTSGVPEDDEVGHEPPTPADASDVSARAFAFDGATGGLWALSDDAQLCAAADAVADADTCAVVLILTRPWRSMRKYGLRGYMYTHLDAAHAAAGTALAAAALGLRARIVPAQALPEPLDRLDELCREPHSAVVLAGERDDDAPVSLGEPGPLEPALDAERELWQRLALGARGHTGHAGSPAGSRTPLPAPARAPGGTEGPPPAGPPRTPPAPTGAAQGTAPVGSAPTGAEAKEATEATEATDAAEATPPAGSPPVRTAPGCSVRIPRTVAPLTHEAFALRHSVRRFGGGPRLTADALAALVAAAGTPPGLTVGGEHAPAGDLAAPWPVVVVRDVDGLAPGVWRVDSGRELLCREEHPVAGDDFVRACMGQTIAEHAQAMIVTCTAGAPPARLPWSLLCAGAASEAVYLHAAVHGVGITCIGAYDDDYCRSTGWLRPDEDVLNVLLLGPDGPADAVKHDREPHSTAHLLSRGSDGRLS